MPIFSMDSKFMQALSRLSDLIILNILFLLTCIPIFTIGAASTAMYTVAFRLGTEEEEGVFRCYFRSFLKNFKQGTALLLMLLVPILLLCCSFLFFLTSPWRVLAYLCVPLLVLLVLIGGYVFPLLSQFQNTVAATAKNALLMGIGYLPQSILVAVLNCIPLMLFIFSTLFFFQMGIVWILVYFSAAAYINAQILKKIFAPYQTPEEERP